MIYRSTHRPAFTLLEVLVSLSIIVVILTLSTVNYKRSNSRNAIIFGAYQLAADIRLAESYAASARQYSTDPSWNVWGVNFTTGANQYRIFVDRNFNGFYDAADAIWRTVKLPASVNIKTLRYKKGAVGPSGVSELSAVYFPPTPSSSLAFDAGLNQFDEAYITLEDNINLSTKEITLNFFGLIDVTK
jgi:prepilin-type N-terminal cleavage/methylation domain-containing protein